MHETVTDGSVYFGLNDEPGDIDETAKFPTAVAMVWRWTGDAKFRDQLYAFCVRNMQYMINLAKSDDDLWPDGDGNVESNVLGADELDVSVYTIRGLLDLADMAASKHDTATEHWALKPRCGDGTRLPESLVATEHPAVSPTRSPTPTTSRSCRGGGPASPRWRPNCTKAACRSSSSRRAADAIPALTLRETSCYSGQWGMYVEGGPGAIRHLQGKTQQAYTLNTGVMAVALGNYGLLGPGQQQRYTDDLAQLQPAGRRATGHDAGDRPIA